MRARWIVFALFFLAGLSAIKCLWDTYREYIVFGLLWYVIDVLEVLEQFTEMMPAGSIVFALIIYVFFALCLALIAKKAGRPFSSSLIMALIPIANIILMLQIAGKPWWWLLLFLVPILNLVIWIIVWMKIAEARGRPGWWGLIVVLVPIVGFIFFLILAFSKEGAKPATAPTM